MLFTLLFSYLNAQMTYEKLINGYNVTDSLTYLSDKVYKVNGKAFDLLSYLKKHQNTLIVNISPYLCGGMANLNCEFINPIAEQFPGQLVIIVSDYCEEETREAIKSLKLNKKVLILTDKDEKNFKRFLKIDDRLMAMGFFIVNNHNQINYIYMESRLNNQNLDTRNNMAKQIIEYLKKG